MDHATAAADEKGFASLVEPYRRELAAHCYRLTGSVCDAEDLLQESPARAWRSLGSLEGRSSLRTWLYRIATNACLNALAKKAPRLMPSDRGAPGDPSQAPEEAALDPIWLEPCPEPFWQATPAGPETCIAAKESVAIAFLAALQTLPPLQRASLILRDVLGFSAAETAEILENSVPAVNSALQRARATLEARRGLLAVGTWLAPEDEETEELLRRYVAAWESGDTQALAALLREDAILTMPPVPTWFAGRDSVCAFLSPLLKAMGEQRLVPTVACGAPAVAAYVRAPGEGAFRPQAIQVLGLNGQLVARVDVFMNPQVFVKFGLPATR